MQLLTILLVLALAAPLSLSFLRHVSPPPWRIGSAMTAALITGLVLVSPAHAAEPGARLFISQAIFDQVNQLVVGVIVALLMLLFKWIVDHTPLKKTQAEQILRDAFNATLYQGAKYGLTQLNQAERHVNGINVGNSAVAAAASYVIAQAPAMAKKLGFDTTTEEGQAAIIRMVTARVGDLMTPPHEPPASVPLPAELQPVTPLATDALAVPSPMTRG